MEIKISKCDTVNKNNIMYPLKEMKKCVSAFNKLSQKDDKRYVHFYRNDNPIASLGKIKKLKIKDGLFVLILSSVRTIMLRMLRHFMRSVLVKV